MSKTYRRGPTSGTGRSAGTTGEDYIVRAKRREQPDLRKLARALLAIAQAQAEAEAEAAHVNGQLAPPRPRKGRETETGSKP